MDHIFKHLISIIVEVYINDIIAKSKKKEDLFNHHQQVFDKLNQLNMKLNARKCIFQVTSAKFLLPHDYYNGNRSQPNQNKGLLDMSPPSPKNKSRN